MRAQVAELGALVQGAGAWIGNGTSMISRMLVGRAVITMMRLER